MKITKFVHSCLLIETPDRVALFDPGMMSEQALDVAALNRLDDIFLTHIHGDHASPDLIKQLVIKFPSVRIIGTPEIVDMLGKQGIKASTELPSGAKLFDSPHESVKPLYPQPEENGYHYLDLLSHPGDSHSFTESKAILALPMTAPWGSAIRALNLALELKPSHVLPIHDWHWRDEARIDTYNHFERILGEQGIIFHKLETGQPINIEVAM